MGETRFAPEELDRIEDALEELEDAEGIEDASEVVRQRLAEYRDILVASREALPMQDPPASVLSAVMAEARRAADEPELVEPTEPAARPSLWTRLRRTLLLPGLAVAGTTALVLIIARPQNQAEPQVEQTALAPSAAKGEAEADVVVSRDKPVTMAAEAEKAAEEAEEAPPPPAQAVPAGPAERPEEQRVSAEPNDEPEPEPASNAIGRGGIIGGAAPSSGAGKGDALDDFEGPRWDIIALGDRARTGGDCGTARKHYRAALEDADARVKARAHAGLGICDAWEGKDVSASEHYQEARKLDPGVSDFIEASRPRSGSSSSKASRASRRSKKSKAKRAAPPASMDEPLSKE